MQNLLYIMAICVLFAGSVLAADETIGTQSINSMQHEMDAQRKALEQAAQQGYEPSKNVASEPDIAHQPQPRARQRDLVGVPIDNKSGTGRSTHIVDVYGEQKRMKNR